MSYPNSNAPDDFIKYQGRYPVDKHCDPDKDRTKQEFKDECDINLIVPMAEATGIIRHQSSTPPTYGDFSNSTDYQSALNSLNDATNSFGELPSEIRERMNNDPGKLLDFLGDPKNRDEAIRLGLVNAPPPEPGPPVGPPSRPEPEGSAQPDPPIIGGE